MHHHLSIAKKTESERDKSDDEHMGVAKRERKKERALESYLLLVMMMRIGRHLTTGMWIPMRQFANEKMGRQSALIFAAFKR